MINRILFMMFLLMLSGCGFEISSDDTDDSFNETSNESVTTNISDGETSQDCSLLVFPDGEGGNLWEPSSELDGNAVVLFDEVFQQPFLSVEARVASTETTDESTELFSQNAGSLFTNPVPETAPPRQTWRGSLFGGFYTGELFITMGDGTVCPVIIPTPGSRVD